MKNDSWQNTHIKDFVRFAARFVDAMEEARLPKPFASVARDTQTEYVVNAELIGFDCEVLLPSYVGVEAIE